MFGGADCSHWREDRGKGGGAGRDCGKDWGVQCIHAASHGHLWVTVPLIPIIVALILMLSSLISHRRDNWTISVNAALTYRHELGMNYAYVLPDLIVGSCLQVSSLYARFVTDLLLLFISIHCHWNNKLHSFLTNFLTYSFVFTIVHQILPGICISSENC